MNQIIPEMKQAELIFDFPPAFFVINLFRKNGFYFELI